MALETNCAMLVSVVPILFATVEGYLFLNDENDENCSALLNISLSVDELVVGSRLSQCPPWFVPDNLTGTCRSGPTLDGLIEQDLSLMQTRVMHCHCMTEENGSLTVGFCFHKCLFETPYYSLPCKISKLENTSCPPYLNRHGYLCSHCIDGYGFPVYSYSLGCVRCENYKYNWVKYLIVAYVPLTLFYIAVALFSVNFTSPMLSGAVMLFQIGGSPLLTREVVFAESQKNYNQIVKAGFTIVSLWNLDFFRSYYSFCLHPKATESDVMALEYGIAIFPVVLIAITYLLVKLHDQNFKVVVWGWKLIQFFLKPLKYTIKTSLIEVFASFVYLSSSRLLLTSVTFLVPSVSYSYQKMFDGNMLLTENYHDSVSQMKYFGMQHLPYALIGIVLSTVFFMAPLVLLFLYPFSWFQRGLNRVGGNSLKIRTFVDVFQGSYKDGTNGTRDYRLLSGLILLVPMTTYIALVLTKSSFSYPISCICIIPYLSLHFALKPFKNHIHNYTMTGFLVALQSLLLSMTFNNFNSRPWYPHKVVVNHTLPLVVIIFLLFVPAAYLFGLGCLLLSRAIKVLWFRN